MVNHCKNYCNENKNYITNLDSHLASVSLQWWRWWPSTVPVQHSDSFTLSLDHAETLPCTGWHNDVRHSCQQCMKRYKLNPSMYLRSLGSSNDFICHCVFSPGLHSWATRLSTSTAAGHCWINSSQKELSSKSCAITKQALKNTIRNVVIFAHFLHHYIT